MTEYENQSAKEESFKGIHSWKKGCLLIVLIVLLFIVMVNITMVLWLMKVLTLNTSSMQCLQVVDSGVQFTGKTYIQDHLVTLGFFSRGGQAMSVRSAENLTMRTTGHGGHIASSIYLGDDGFEITTSQFKAIDQVGKTMFSVDKDIVALTAGSLYISGEGGSLLEGSLQTQVVSAPIGADLKLESATRAVETVTPAAVSIESRAGDILSSSNLDVSLISVDGSIKLEANRLLMPNLRRSQPFTNVHKHRHHAERIYQLCICSSGDLYLGDPDGFCETGSALLC